MISLKLFEVMQNSDKTEGRGPSMPTGIAFFDPSDANAYVTSEEYASKYGVMGCRGSKYDIRETHLIVYEKGEFDLSPEGREIRRVKELKEKALAKLSGEERKILGL